MRHQMKDVILKVLFSMFAISLILAAIAFNLENIKLTLISFGVSVAFAALMVIFDRILPNKDKSPRLDAPTETAGK